MREYAAGILMLAKGYLQQAAGPGSWPAAYLDMCPAQPHERWVRCAGDQVVQLPHLLAVVGHQALHQSWNLDGLAVRCLERGSLKQQHLQTSQDTQRQGPVST
jgi:hypothetical protein